MDPSNQQFLSWTPLDLMALAIVREARGEGNLGRRGVGWVIQNRANNGGWYAQPRVGTPVHNVILKPWQFSSFNPGDPNASLIPSRQDPIWLNCRLLAAAILNGQDSDITNDADYYHSLPVTEENPNPFPQTWGNREDYKLTLHVGAFFFYRFAPMLSNRTQVQDAATDEN